MMKLEITCPYCQEIQNILHFLVQVVLENGFEAAIALDLYIQPFGSRLQALITIGLFKAHDAQYRPEALLRGCS
jgi:hypothetical protein